MKLHRILDIPPYSVTNKCWNVIIETPRGSRHKFKYEPKHNVFCLHRTLPEGMTFPYDFGFLPRTRGADGDPVDVLLIMPDASFSGCMVAARLVGVIEALQTERNGERERNDRLVAIPVGSRDEGNIHSVKELNPKMLREVEEFFATYNRIDGKQFKVLKLRGPNTAAKLARASMRTFAKSGKS